jgi:glycosyltransferase involved in cell wall biosynthesis
LGVSRARNTGLAHARGDIIGFPDDDCWYDESVTSSVVEFFAAHPEYAALTGRTIGADGMTSVSPYQAESGAVMRSNAFTTGNTNTLFVRRPIAVQIGFNETLGPGAGTQFLCGEDTDFVLTFLAGGHRAYYSRDLTVYHDAVDTSPEARIARAQKYSVGFGRVLRIHRYGPQFLATRVGRAVLRGAFCLATGDVAGARARYSWVAGSIRGYSMRRDGARRSGSA